MSMQISDSVLIEGEYFSMGHSLRIPDPHPAILGQHPSPARLPHNSANWRGYTASWAIVEKRLYLMNLTGKYHLTSRKQKTSALPLRSNEEF